MKIIIAGGGKVGASLIRQLTTEGHEITLVDSSTDVLEEIMEQYDIIAVQGNAASMDVLSQAGAEDANLVIAATDMDEVNLLCCMTAHVMNPDLHTIARIRNPEYRNQTYLMRDRFALNMVINPEEEAAKEIARLLQLPGFLKIDMFAKGSNEIAELKITADSPIKGVPLNKLSSVVRSQVLICAVQRDGQCIMPDGNFVLKENDIAYVTASQANLASLLDNLHILSRKVKQVMIVGGGKISYYLAKELENSGIRATIVEKSEKRCQELATVLPEVTVVQGDASSQEFLDSEGIENFDALVTLTGMDELNIVMSLYGHTRKVPAVITKLSHAENNRILDALPIGSVISPKELICSSLVRYVRAMQNKEGAAVTVHMIANGQGEAMEFIVDEETKHIGEPLRDLKIKSNVLVVSISRGWSSELPDGGSKFQLGDTVVIVTNDDSKILQLNDIFED
ncbi:MAG: Trk system potassium transporter TrkA [Solobacterium sp.]|nr:Trk system potassium transporter TrkA [Solobacterium sp.]